MARARAVLWDLGNTLIDWDPRRLYRKLLPGEAAVEDFLGRVCTLDWHAAHDRGVPMAQNREALIAAHPDKAGLIRAWDERWDEMFDGYVEGMDALFHDLRAAGASQYALSNLPAEKWPPLKAMYPDLEKLDAAVISGEEGLVKPEPRLFDITIRRIAHPPDETIFIDDRAENVDAARRAGFRAHAFSNAQETRRVLRLAGLPV